MQGGTPPPLLVFGLSQGGPPPHTHTLLSSFLRHCISQFWQVLSIAVYAYKGHHYSSPLSIQATPLTKFLMSQCRLRGHIVYYWTTATTGSRSTGKIRWNCFDSNTNTTNACHLCIWMQCRQCKSVVDTGSSKKNCLDIKRGISIQKLTPVAAKKT